MDYPSDNECIKRFLDQGIFTETEIQRAMDNTDICLTFENFYFSKDIKLPTLYPDKTQEEKNKIYSRLITKKFKEYMKYVPAEDYDRYYQGVKEEVQVYKDTGMVDYPLINYEVIKRGIELGGVITDSGRGSAVGFFTNTLCGFSKVDRFTSAIHLYPERFMSTSRILESGSLPDIDFNVANTEPFERAQKEILGEEHSYPMIAFGTLKKKSAFKLYARAKDVPAAIANEITKQIEKYENDLKHADDDDRRDINIYDYVDEQYHDHLRQSESYWGIISDRKKAPSAHLLYQGNIRKEIGLIKCKSESTKKECITCVIDGAVAEEYKFLKNDLLTVNVVDIIDRVFKRIGIEHFNVNTLLGLIKNDKPTWDIYAKGLTIGVNQCEKASTTKKAMRYKPRNPSELSAFIAGIRPGFKSMYPIFESRQPFSYGVATLDNLLITEELPIPFMIFQEQTMKVLNYAGFPMDECYGLIKAISKKKPEKVKAIKDDFIKNFCKQIQEDNGLDFEIAQNNSEKVWTVVNDNSGYAFNSSHAYCMALDSLYCAYLKSHYPYEFYEVLLTFYSNKGNKDKVAELKREMLQGFGIREGKFKFGNDNRSFKADKENGVIYSSLLSLKNMNQKCSEDLYALSQKKQYTNFFTLLKDIKQLKSLKSDQLNILINIGYFDDFGTVPQIQTFVKAYDDLYGRAQFSKDNLDANYAALIAADSTQTEKQYRNFDYENALHKLWMQIPPIKLGLHQKIKNELEYFGYIQTIIPKLSDEYVVVTDKIDKYSKLTVTVYVLQTGAIHTYRMRSRVAEQCGTINVGDIIKLMKFSEEKKWTKNVNGDWVHTDETETLIKKYALTR